MKCVNEVKLKSLRFTHEGRMASIVRSTFAVRGVLANRLIPACSCVQTRWHNKHYNPKFKWHRGKKVIDVELPDYDEAQKAGQMTPEQMRQKMKEKGILPGRPWTERPISISCTGATLDPYIPPEGDGKLSAITAGGVKQTVTKFGKQSKSYLAMRKVKTYEEEFDQAEFADFALDAYKKAHDCLSRGDHDELHEYATEKAHDDMTWNMKRKTVRWNYVKSLELPRIVQARIVEMLSKENLYAQLTVRFHSQQTLAIYDRFGRLEYGSEVIAKDVLEYVVFEKHLVNEYGVWRIHDKITPPWAQAKAPLERTFRKPEYVEELEAESRKIEMPVPLEPPRAEASVKA